MNPACIALWQEKGSLPESAAIGMSGVERAAQNQVLVGTFQLEP
jgi:hypothetical protein